MATTPIGQAGLQGLRNSLDRAQDAANRIVKATTTSDGSLQDVTEAVVDLKSAELGAKASARVVETANRTTGSLIDILA
jgi:hypothetical protein